MVVVGGGGGGGGGGDRRGGREWEREEGREGEVSWREKG